MLSRVFCVSLVFLLLGLTAANQIIFDDFTSLVTFTLPPGLNNPADTDVTYHTNLPGSLSFGLSWNGDQADDFSIALASLPALTLTVLNNLAVCSLAPTGVTLNQANPQCNYTLSWTVPFFGVLSITYNTGDSPIPPAAQQISIPFSSGIAGDPQFFGLRGQSYQVHGIDGAVYNIISEKNTQVNSRFAFLTQGQCPLFEGVPDTNCWSHPGSYMGEMSFQQVVDGKLHAALVTAGSAKKGFASVQMDGKVIKVGETVSFGSFSVAMKSSHAVVVSTEHFEFELSNSDMFINQGLRSKVPLSQLESHGLLGQTHNSKTYSTAIRYIEGDVDDYVIADNDVFGDDFVYNKFQL